MAFDKRRANNYPSQISKTKLIPFNRGITLHQENADRIKQTVVHAAHYNSLELIRQNQSYPNLPDLHIEL
jgi:hypothetical protein